MAQAASQPQTQSRLCRESGNIVFIAVLIVDLGVECADIRLPLEWSLWSIAAKANAPAPDFRSPAGIRKIKLEDQGAALPGTGILLDAAMHPVFRIDSEIGGKLRVKENFGL
jgi:hypothetical protein